MKDFKYWKVIPVLAQYEHALGDDAPAHTEWVRLMVGRVLAPAQRDRAGTWEFLVQGIPLEGLADSGDPDAFSQVEEAVKADFKVLRGAIEQIRRDLHSERDPMDRPHGFVREYGILPMITLPTRDERWEVTDEGLTIVGWGAARDSRRLLDWDERALADMERTVLDKVSKARPQSPAQTHRPAAARDPDAESRALQENRRQVRSESQNPARPSAPEPRVAGSQSPRPPQPRAAASGAASNGSLRSAIAGFDTLEWCAVVGVVLAILAVGLVVGTVLRGGQTGVAAPIAAPSGADAGSEVAPSPPKNDAGKPKAASPAAEQSPAQDRKAPPAEADNERVDDAKNPSPPATAEPASEPSARDAEAAVSAPRMTVGG